MTDQEFLDMKPRPAIDYWLAASTPKERERLHHLYLVKRKVNLSDMVLRDPTHRTTSETVSETPKPDLVAWGKGALGLGLAISICTFLFMDPSVATPGGYGIPDRVANFDMMERRALIIGFGNMLAIVGSVLMAAGLVVRAIDRLQNPPKP
ncbi:MULTISPECIES: hypothetical protein [unclassified Brevundimonas]|jgi:hypothetical protein|uniref:hypothetical protein n=1 Tax=unclassified Brevundimonas TaxID=2622653 RepID=UPI000EED4790|nr:MULTISPECIES: hypothetical protein [unclassified Brevundimonas]HAJ02307.1 hypothetical protein [Brevundimonas sp.]|tara:strand:+ start:1048 stop:1500 length:453 start_codon:yes stop_codon:yes gene_type:complete